MADESQKQDLASQSARERLRAHFTAPYDEHGQRWDKLWETRDFLPWDKGVSSPALVDALNNRQDVLNKPVDESGRRRVALVPGCGGGYDVLLLASLGYDAYGLEISEKALKFCHEVAEREYSTYTAKAPEHGYGPGSYNFIKGNFFNDQWLSENNLREGGFDLIYDYTFICALPPKQRPAWSLRHSTLLSPQGRLVCLEFPTYKAPETEGPPWGMRSDIYLAHLTRPGEQLPYGEDGYPKDGTDSGRGAPALERIAHWQPERTHPIGQGTDWMSVWKHR